MTHFFCIPDQILMRTRIPARIRFVLFTLFSCFASAIFACPFCPPVSSTMTEQFAESQNVVLAEWDSVKLTEEASITSFLPLKMDKGDKETFDLKKNIEVEDEYMGNKGDLFLLFGGKDKELTWHEIIPVSETSYQYILQAPPREADNKTRLTYFLKFLEFPDPIIADDAFSEFAQASYENVASLSGQFPVDKIRKWLGNPEMPATRIGLFALMLGLSGNKQDAELLRHKMKTLDDEFHLGLDGLMAGYVLLVKSEGLDELDKEYLNKEEASSSETFAAMKALRFLHEYAQDKINPERIEKSMRLLLKRPAMTELVIIDLARWKDWSIAEELMNLYDQPEHDSRPTRRSILSYLMVYQKENSGTEKPDHSSDLDEKITRFLEKAKKDEPRAYREAERMTGF